MGAKDHTEKVLRELHVLLAKSELYENNSEYILVDKKQMQELLKEFAVCMSEIMDEYEMTKESREQGLRENRRVAQDIIKDAKMKAEDVYAASVLYTDDALKRMIDIMQDSSDAVKAVYKEMEQKLARERQKAICDKSDLKGHLHGLHDTDKYMAIIEERNKKIAKEKRQKEDNTIFSYTSAKPEIKVNRDYFEKQGIDLYDGLEILPDEEIKRESPQVNVNFNAEYFKRKEQEDAGELQDYKKSEKKNFFGKFMK